MKKFLILIIAVFTLAGCGGKTVSQAIIDSSIEKIDRAQTTIRKTQTVEQCQSIAIEALTSTRADIINIGESCKTEIKKIESDLIRWKGYFWILFLGVCVTIYIFVVRKLSNNLF